MPGGVKGLAAMFEQRGDSKPSDDRGRSPGPVRSGGTPTPTPESPRPLSKVRTSFVAVEKDGRMGLRREHSGDSVSVSSRRSNETGTTTPQPIPEKPDAVSENMEDTTIGVKTDLSPEPTPEVSKQTTPIEEKKVEESPPLAPNPNPDKITDEEEPSTTLKPGLPTDTAAIQGEQQTSNGTGDGLKPSSSPGKAKATAVSKPAATTKPVPKAIATTSTKTVPKATKSPTAAIAKSRSRERAKPTSSAPEKKPTTTAAASKDQTAVKKAAAPKSTATATKKPSPAGLAPSNPVKPKAKSPTRPTHPPSAGASKVSSGSTPGRQSSSRASGTSQNLNVQSTSRRPSSRTSGMPSGPSTTKPLRRQSSTASRTRPSLGPPPKQAAKDHPVAKREGHVDESFLARMMRPTQASSSKTSEKIISPPRKVNSPATTQTKRSVSKDAEGNAKKAAARLQATVKPKTTGAAHEAAEEPKTTAKEVAPAVAQTETAEAAIEAAKASKETATTPLVEKASTEVAIEPTAEGVAPVAAQAETAEAAIEAAKVSTDTAVTPLVEKTEPKAVDEQPTGDMDGASDNKTVSPVPAVSSEPEKVEDIEDVVQESVGSPDEKVDESAVAAEPTLAASDAKEDVAPPATEVQTTEEDVKEELKAE